MRVHHVTEGSLWPTGYRSDHVVEPWMPGETRVVKRPLGVYLVSTFVGHFVDLDASEPTEPAPVADPFDEVPPELQHLVRDFVGQAPEEVRTQLLDGIVTELRRIESLPESEREQLASPESRLDRVARWVALGATHEAAAAFEGLGFGPAPEPQREGEAPPAPESDAPPAPAPESEPDAPAPEGGEPSIDLLDPTADAPTRKRK